MDVTNSKFTATTISSKLTTAKKVLQKPKEVPLIEIKQAETLGKMKQT